MISILSAIAVLCLLWTLPFILAIWKTHQMTFPLPRNEHIAVEQVPDYLHDLFESGITELEQYGFTVSGYYCTKVDNAEDRKHWHTLLQHKSKHTYATLSVLKPLTVHSSVNLSFLTFFADHSLFVTQCEPLLGWYSPNPREIFQYLGAVSSDVQWEGHQHKLAALCESKEPQKLTSEAFTNTWEAFSANIIEQHVQKKEVCWSQTGDRYRLSLLTSIKAVIKTEQYRRKKRSQSFSQPHNHNIESFPAKTEAAIALEVEEFYHLQQQRRSGSRRSKTLWLLGSLTLFIATYAVIFNPQRLVIFIAVLLLHEGGHVLAMKLFGYRDAAMLFIPFLGALATARKDNASLTEKVWISLAGPLPGLCLGIGLAIYNSFNYADPTAMDRLAQLHPFNWMQETTFMLIFLNLFNLLPVYPLDGGQVTDLLIFSRNPYVGVVFKAIGVGLLGSLGLGFQKPLLLTFAIIIALSIPMTFRLAKLNAKLRKDLRSIPAINQAELVQFIFSQLQQPPYHALPFHQKYGLAIGLLDSHQEQSAPWTTRVGLTSVYFVSLLIGFAGVVIALIPNWLLVATALQNRSAADRSVTHKQMVQARQDQMLQQANQSIVKDPKNIMAYIKRSQAKIFLKDYQGAIADATQALKLDPKNIEARLMRGAAALKIEDYKGAIADTSEVIRIEPKNTDAYELRSIARTHLGDLAGAKADTQIAERLFETQENN